MSVPVRALLLDVMGTLVEDPFYDEVPAFLGMPLERLLREKHPSAWIEFEHGEIGERELFERFFLDGRAFDGAGLKRRMVESYRWIAGMPELLAELAARGLPMHALSNYPCWYRELDARLKLSRFLEWSFVSCDTGVRKPAPEAYLGAAERLGLAPAECLFVDDREVNCAAARALGMGAVRFEDSARLRAELRRRGLLD